MSTTIPIHTSHLDTISPNEYQVLQRTDCIEGSPKEIIYMNKRGTLVKYQKSISGCERMARLAECAFVTPFALLISLFTCCQCEAVELSIDHYFGPGMDGVLIEEGFLEDQLETKELWDRDFQALGYERSDKENLIQLVESGKFPHIQSTYSQHTYMSFYGPHSTLSYLILIPDRDAKNARLFVVCNDEKKPCNESELHTNGELLCQEYKLGTEKVNRVTKFVLVTTSTSNF